ncbi:MAG: HlyD family efflux transporter periplasmic adaptor subunit [Christensenellales bacterium]|jgi:hypothetical protein
MDYREYYESRSRERKKNRRFRMKPRFFVFIAVLLAVIIIPVALLSRPNEYLIGYGAYDAVGEGFDALIIRSEISFYSETYGQASYKVVEGQNVRGGETVLDMFASDYTSQLLADLQTVRQNIKIQQEDSLLSKIVDPELYQYNDEIQAQVDIVSGYKNNPSHNIASAELKLHELMNQRQNYLKSTSVAQADSALTELYSNETQLMGRIENWRTAYLAPEDGRISVYFDGLEPALGEGIIDLLDISGVQNLLGGQKPDMPATGQPLYRLVNPNKWYVAFTAPSSKWQAGIGQEVLINIEGYNGLNATATVLRTESDEKGVTTLVVLEVTKDIGSLIGERFAFITVGSNTEGLMVPRKAVHQVDGAFGVYLTDGTFIPVDILASDPSHYIIMPATPGALDKGMTIKAR